MQHEIWQPIPTLSPYFASNLGRIAKKIPHKTDTIMWTRVQKGYERLLLTVEANVRKDFLVHRLVAMAFHGLPTPDRKEVNHIDGNKTNNIPENLEWVSRSENLRHYYHQLNGMDHRPRGDKQWQAKFTDEDVRLIRQMRHDGASTMQIRDRLGKPVTATNICNIIHGRTYSHIK